MHQLRRLLDRMQDPFSKAEEEPGQVQGWKRVRFWFPFVLLLGFPPSNTPDTGNAVSKATRTTQKMKRPKAK